MDGFHAAVSPSAGRDDPRIAPGLGSRARQVHQAASFGDGDALGPVKTDVLVLLGRGTLFSAPFRNSISRALLADHAFECSDLCFSSRSFFSPYEKSRHSLKGWIEANWIYRRQSTL